MKQQIKMKIFKMICALGLLTFNSMIMNGQQMKKTIEVSTQIKTLISQMTLEQKLTLLHGFGSDKNEFGDANVNLFGVRGINNLGIPDVYMGHGLTGVRLGRDTSVYSTYMCAPIGIGCTWNVKLYEEVGAAIAKEMRGLGQDLNLGPTINIIRHPLGGRNWESLSEDPYLTARFIVPYVQAMQTNGIICGPKHFVANNQETSRFDINNVVDERTLREIYLPAFRAAVVEGGALNIMASYNRLNGVFMCQNRLMLTDILRKEWGFDGFVLSDFAYGVRSTLAAANAGLNIEMHGSKFYGDKMMEEVKNGHLGEFSVDSLLYEYLTVVYRMGIPERERSTHYPIHSQSHIDLSRKVAQEAPVLLKNENLLPLHNSKSGTIAVIGPNAKDYKESSQGYHRAYYMQGGGSGRTYYYPGAVVEPVKAIQSAVGFNVNVSYAQGCITPDISITDKARFNEKQNSILIDEAVRVAKSADVVLLFMGLSGYNETEGRDKKSMSLPSCQEQLIEAVNKVNKNVVVIVIAGSSVDMTSWQDKVKAILYVPYCGEQVSNGVADILFGKVSPSGRLPFTWAQSVNDYPKGSILIDEGYGKTGKSNVYSEGIFVGYRWFDKQNIQVVYPFGYGLSYTNFNYGNITLIEGDDYNYTIEFPVTNEGKCESSEVVQLYVNDVKCSINRPIIELKAFEKISLRSNETKVVRLKLDKEAFSFFDSNTKQWLLEPGEFKVSVGVNSRDLRQSIMLNLN